MTANSILLSYFIRATNDIHGGYRSALRSSTALAVSKWFSGLRWCIWCSCRGTRKSAPNPLSHRFRNPDPAFLPSSSLVASSVACKLN